MVAKDSPLAVMGRDQMRSYLGLHLNTNYSITFAKIASIKECAFLNYKNGK